MDDATKFGLLSTLLGVGAAALDALPTPAAAPVRGGKRRHGKLGGGCTPCQGRADANETLRNAAKMVGLSAKSAVPKGGI